MKARTPLPMSVDQLPHTKPKTINPTARYSEIALGAPTTTASINTSYLLISATAPPALLYPKMQL